MRKRDGVVKKSRKPSRTIARSPPSKRRNISRVVPDSPEPSDESTVEGDVVEEEEEEEEDFPTLDDIGSVPSSPVSKDFDGMFMCVEKAFVLRKIIDVLADMLEEVNMTFTEDGLDVFALDSAHIVCVILTLKSENFQGYSCSRHPITIGVNMASLKKIFSCITAKDAIDWRLHGTNPDKVTISVEQTGVSQTFEMKLLDITEDPMDVPDTRYPNKVRLSTKEFRDKTTLFTTLGGGALECTIAPGSFVMTMKEADMVENSRATFTPVEDEPEEVLIDCDESITNTFITRYIARIAKAASISKWVNIEMHPDLPMKFVFAAGDLGQFTLYLSPKIQDE